MRRRLRRSAARLVLAAAILGISATAALAYVTSDLVDFNLTESVSTYGAPTLYHMSQNGTASYRWLDSPSKTTVISGNSCSDLSLFGSTSISAGDTSYAGLFNAPDGTCFVVRGRTASGQGSMTYYDGRIQR